MATADTSGHSASPSLLPFFTLRAQVKRVVPQLITYGKVVQPTLDVQIASDAIAQRLKVGRGALVQGLTAGGAGDKAGLLPTRRGLSGIITGGAAGLGAAGRGAWPSGGVREAHVRPGRGSWS